jgi:hypothetical protein
MRRQAMCQPPTPPPIVRQEILTACDVAPGQLVPLAALPASWHMLVAQVHAHFASRRRRPRVGESGS